jgi:hypothetical protein
MPMTFALLAPFALFLSGAPAPAAGLVVSNAGWQPLGDGSRDAPLAGIRITGIHKDISYQVRIEQHLQIRISPRQGPMPVQLEIEESRTISDPRYAQTKAGKCIAANNFSSVGAGPGRRLFLFTRDNRVFSALLERGCQARDYYQGFYLAASPDAKLCVDRDRLLSRAGANCRLKQIRELVEVGD